MRIFIDLQVYYNLHDIYNDIKIDLDLKLLILSSTGCDISIAFILKSSLRPYVSDLQVPTSADLKFPEKF